YVVATNASDGVKVLARFDGKKWQVLRRGEAGLLRGWPGNAGSLWLQDPNGLHHDFGTRVESVEREGVLSGTISSVVPEPSGVIWVSTNQGAARYAPPLWQTPLAVAHIRSGVQDS